MARETMVSEKEKSEYFSPKDWTGVIALENFAK